MFWVMLAAGSNSRSWSCPPSPRAHNLKRVCIRANVIREKIARLRCSSPPLKKNKHEMTHQHSTRCSPSRKGRVALQQMYTFRQRPSQNLNHEQLKHNTLANATKTNIGKGCAVAHFRCYGTKAHPPPPNPPPPSTKLSPVSSDCRPWFRPWFPPAKLEAAIQTMPRYRLRKSTPQVVLTSQPTRL